MKTFDALIDNLRQGDQTQIIDELKEAKKHVNGLTDGWFDFKIALEKTLESNRTSMTADQVRSVQALIETLNDALTSAAD